MKSPFTGGETKLQMEPRVLEYRKDSFEVLYHYYVCVDSGEQFTTTEIETLNINQVHNKYRSKYGIPFIDEIRLIRNKYGLSAAKMSEVLGLGVNVYRNYESGEMPSVATGRLIRLAENAEEFRKLLEMSKNALESAEYERVRKKVDHAQDGTLHETEILNEYWFGYTYPNIYNGYRVPSMEKIGLMVRFFAQENKPFLTALNKLMFYADFGHFKKHAHSISGICYRALPKGPVPDNYGSIYNYVVNKGFVKMEEINFGEYVGDRFITDGIVVIDSTDGAFTDTELDVLEKVSKRFMGLTTKMVVDISHEEPAWLDNVNDIYHISFEYGFALKNMEL